MNWNDRYQSLDTPWDKGLATPVLGEMVEARGELFRAGTRVLVPGCGPGYEARWLAGRGCKVTGQDIAPLAIEKARELDVESSVEFEVADFLNPAERLLGAFDVVFENTCFCALPPDLRADYLRGAWAVLKPGGTLAGVFFIDPEMAVGESGPPFGIGVEELFAMAAAAGFEVRESWVPVTGFNGRIGRELVGVMVKGEMEK